ncbi:MAG: Fe(3+) ABC transporter substrate-binding protein [Rhodospirillaceae bacterium]|nr:Fe(3+) ABC transporter substrate-binding protein [Rhodospirillaceae bacterium]
MRRWFTGKALLAAGALIAAATAFDAGRALAASEVNVYSTRQEYLISPFLDRFEEETGTKVNVVFIKEGLIERLKAEGRNTPADVVLAVDIANLAALKRADLLQPIKSAVLDENVPPAFRDPEGEWVGLTTRARVIYYSKERVDPAELSTYEDLTDPKWKGRICVRTGNHDYNVALVASLIAAHGEEKAEEIVRGVVANFARKPQGNDRAQVKAVKEGECDIAIGNTYYMGKMATNDEKPEEKEWAAATAIFFPNADGRGTHVNISGAALAKHAPHSEAGIALIEFLSGDEAQAMYAKDNFEYPIKAGVALDSMVASWGVLKPDTVNLQKIADLSPAAQKLIDRVGWQ